MRYLTAIAEDEYKAENLRKKQEAMLERAKEFAATGDFSVGPHPNFIKPSKKAEDLVPFDPKNPNWSAD